MPKLELTPGEEISITFADSDGEIKVAFEQEAIVVSTDWPDTLGREGVIYSENFGLDDFLTSDVILVSLDGKDNGDAINDTLNHMIGIVLVEPSNQVNPGEQWGELFAHLKTLMPIPETLSAVDALHIFAGEEHRLNFIIDEEGSRAVMVERVRNALLKGDVPTMDALRAGLLVPKDLPNLAEAISIVLSNTVANGSYVENACAVLRDAPIVGRGRVLVAAPQGDESDYTRLARLVLETHKVREASYEKKPDLCITVGDVATTISSSEYTLTLDEAAAQVTNDPAEAGLIALLLYTASNDILDWATARLIN